MLLENSFEVEAPLEDVWDFLLDVERVAPCMPGAELTETVDGRHYKGKVSVRIGPVSLSFKGTVEMAEVDEAAHRVVLKGRGQEQRGKGAAEATITSTLTSLDGRTRVEVVQDLNVTGQAAQMARGMLGDVSRKLTQQFADCLETKMGAAPAPATAAEQTAAAASQPAGPAAPKTPERKAEPVRGASLLVTALAGSLRRLLQRVLSARKSRS